MKRITQRLVQVAFLVLFILLVVTSKPQIWVAVFLIGVVASFFISRIYCGWACPINTLMVGVTWVKKKLKLKSLKIPAFVKQTWFRYFFLLLFIAVFAFSMITGKRLPVLPGLVVLGALLTLFFPEALWHRYLCPYGTVLQFPAKTAKKRMEINPEACINCTICAQVCPAEAVSRNDKTHLIQKEDCMVCMNCSEACPTTAIKYH